MMQLSMPNQDMQTNLFIEELDETQLIGIVGGSVGSLVQETSNGTGTVVGALGQTVTEVANAAIAGAGQTGQKIGGLRKDVTDEITGLVNV